MKAPAAVGLGLDVLNTGAGLANLYYQNKWEKKQDAMNQKRFEEEQRQYQDQMNEYQDEKRRKLEAQKLADLFSNSSWLGEKDQERLGQNYGYYVKNLRK